MMEAFGERRHLHRSEFSPEVEHITNVIGDTPFWWEGVGYDEPTPHWKHGFEAGCVICKAGYAPLALRLLIERILSEHAEVQKSANVSASGRTDACDA